MVSSPPRPRARRAAQPATSATTKKSSVPSGAEIAAALLGRSQSPRPTKPPIPAASDVSCVSKLSVSKTVCDRQTTLHFVGALNAVTLSQVRDEAFTAIGARPPHLCIDLTDAESPDPAALDSLVTIASVARMMGVTFCVRVPAPLMCLLEASHLSRLIPIDQTNDAPPSPHVDWLETAPR